MLWQSPGSQILAALNETDKSDHGHNNCFEAYQQNLLQLIPMQGVCRRTRPSHMAVLDAPIGVHGLAEEVLCFLRPADRCSRARRAGAREPVHYASKDALEAAGLRTAC